MKGILEAMGQEEIPTELTMQNFYHKITFMDLEAPNGETGADKLAKIDGLRILKTHLPYDLWKDNLDKHPNMKVVLTLRNPKDTLVSQFHHYRSAEMLGAFNGTWDQFFELFKAKKLAWGDYFEVNAGWYKFNKDRANSLILKYEDMQKDHRGHVIKIANFMGFELPGEAVDQIVEATTVKMMSPKFAKMLKGTAWIEERSSFIRKGIVGDWVNYFTQEQSGYVDAETKVFLEPLGISFEY